VAGAGILGASCARSLSSKGYEVLVIERHFYPGFETSSRNSEVIHAGIYYPKYSLKSQLCIHGKNMLYDYARVNHISHNNCGKLIVANKTEFEKLLSIQKSASDADVQLKLIQKRDVAVMQPGVQCDYALYSNTTGIIDSHGLLTQMIADAESNGTIFLYDCTVNSPIIFGRRDQIKYQYKDSSKFDGFQIPTSQGMIYCDMFINACGLNSLFIAKSIVGHPSDRVPRAYYAKGNYFKLNCDKPFHHLIYPVPSPGGLGIHATLDLNNCIKFGPDVDWLIKPNDHLLENSLAEDETDHDRLYEYDYAPEINSRIYQVSDNLRPKFERAIKDYYPALLADNLTPDYAGIRTKLIGPDALRREYITDHYGRNLIDFVIEGPSHHGIPGLVNLYGMESPGLTASLAIGQYVANLLE
jgi:L-2-hydroxyglutarate oxidase LhgO